MNTAQKTYALLACTALAMTVSLALPQHANAQARFNQRRVFIPGNNPGFGGGNPGLNYGAPGRLRSAGGPGFGNNPGFGRGGNPGFGGGGNPNLGQGGFGSGFAPRQNYGRPLSTRRGR